MPTPPPRPAMRKRSRARSRHGVALLAVVFLAIAASTVSLLIVRQVLASARASSGQAAAAEAREIAGALLDDVVATISADPTVHLRQVLDAEDPRECILAAPDDATLLGLRATHPIYPAGAAWPGACGAVWTYPQAPVDPVAVRVAMPTVDSPAVTVQALAKAGPVVLGRQAELRASDAGRYAIYTIADVDLEGLDGASVNGGIYTAGRMLLPRTATVGLGQVQLIAEETIAGTLTPQDGVRYYTLPADPNATPPVGDPRTVVDVVGSDAALDSAVDLTFGAACPRVPPRAVTVDTVASASSLCLEPGGTAVAVDGTSVALPSDAVAWLVLPAETAPGTIDLLARSSRLDVAGCVATCDLPALADALVGAGLHPGTLAGWTPVATLRLPVSGLVGSPVDVQVGLCGSQFLSGATPCRSVRPSRPLTFVAGDSRAPADVWAGGPLSDVGLVAGGDVVLPYWAAGAATTATLDVHTVAAGTLRSHPDRPVAFGASVRLTGSTVVGRFSRPAGWTAVTFAPVFDATLPPWLPGPQATFSRAATADLTSVEACGQRACADW